jgi:stage IV sporulation protein B
MQCGDALEVVLGGIHKGECGNPGELSGIMTDVIIGRLDINTEVGVFGTINKDCISNLGESYQVAKRSEIKPGEASIISTVKNGKKAEYKIEIYDIDQSSTGSKSFKIRVKDPALIAITGGIVRGMSGSPIIQNGKLVGAVTHVLVNDPTIGYGIFIENMINTNSASRKNAA